MAGIGDAWGTEEELLHPRGPDGRWIRKAGIAKSAIQAVLGFLASFRPRSFQNQGQASQYLQNVSRRARYRMGRGDLVRLSTDLGPANADLRDGVIDEPSTQRFVSMMDRSATELPDDVILARVVGVDAFGFTPETAKGTNSDTDPGIRGMSGKLVADRAYGLHVVGDIEAPAPAGTVRMVVAAKKGTKVIIPGATPNDSTIFTDRGQPMRITKIRQDGTGGWTMFVTAEPGGGRAFEPSAGVPESIAGPVGEGRLPSKEREARIKRAAQGAARQDKVPDEDAEAAEEARKAEERAKMGAPVPSPQQEAERRRVEQITSQQPPRQPAPGEPPPRTEPAVGRVGEAPTTGAPPPGTPAPGATVPEAPTAPRRVVDIRTAVRDAGIPSPSRGQQLQEWNEAYLGLKSGKLEPDEAARNLDANIRRNRGLAEDLGSQPGNEARIVDLQENIRAQEQLRDLIREQYDLPGAGTEALPTPTPVKKAPAAPAVKRTEAGLPRQEGLTPVKKAAPRKRAADRDAAAKETVQSWLESAGVSESDLGDMDRTGVAVVGDLVARRRISKAEAVRRLRTDREGSLLNRIADAIETSPRKKAAKKAAPAKAAPAKKAPAKKAAPEATGDPLDRMTKADLIAEAGRRGVTARQSWTKDRIKKAIRDREEAGAQAPEAPAPVKRAAKAAVPGAAPGTAAGKITAGRIQPGMRVLVTPGKNGQFHPSTRKTGQTTLTVERIERVAVRGGRRSQTRLVLVGRDENGNEIRTNTESWDGKATGVPSHQTFIVAPEPGAAPVKKAAKAVAPSRVADLDQIARSTASNPDTVRQQLLVTEEDDRFRYLEDLITPLNLTESRRLARGLGVKSAGRSEKPEIIQAIVRHFEGVDADALEGRPDREQAARDRQARIDRARSYGDVAAEIEELINGDVDKDVLTRGILRAGRGLPPEELDELVQGVESGNLDRVRTKVNDLLRGQGVSLFHPAGTIERFDRSRHEAIGEDIPDGAMIHVVRPGVEANIDGEQLSLRKATVEVATPQETVREEQAKRIVPEGSVPGARTDIPVDNALRKRELRKAWIAADIQAPPGSGRKSQEEIKGDLLAGRITPEEAIRRFESEVSFNNDDLHEVEAHLREGDLSDAERGKLIRHRDNLIATRESNEAQSEFLRKYFKGEGPVVSLEEAKVQDPVSYEFLKDATPDDLREAAKEAGLDAPSGDTPDEMFTDLLKQVARKELERRAAKKAAKKAPAKKVAKKAAPEVPRDKERVDARLLAEGLELEPEIIDTVQRGLDGEAIPGTGKNPTPRQIAENVDGHARARSDHAGIMYGNWDIGGRRTPEEDAKREQNLQSERLRAQHLQEFAERIRGVRRKKAAPAKAATPEVAKLQDKVDDLEKRRIDDALGELGQSGSNRDRAEAALDGLTMPELRRLAEQSGVPTHRTKAGLKKNILDRFVPEQEVTLDQFRDLPSREAAHELLAPLSKPELMRMARELSIPGAGSKNMTQLRQEIVEGTTGRRLDSIAIRGFEGARPGLGDVQGRPDLPTAGAPEVRRTTLAARAREAGITHPGETFSDVDSAVGEADSRLRGGESPTTVARFLRERAARVAKADIMEEGRRFKTEKDRDSLLAIRKSSAEYLRRVSTHVQQEGKASKTAPAKKAAPSAPSPSRTGTSPVGGTRSTTPEIPNRWGALGTGGEVEFHDDGVIGQRLRQMGDDRLMDVDGEPLSNVIGKLATRAIRGEISQEQLLMDLDRLYKRLPAGSRAKGQVKSMMEDLDAPARPMPDLPEGTPAPFRTAIEKLLQIPFARDAVDRPGFHRDRENSEVDKLLRLLEEFKQGRTGGLRFITAIQNMRTNLPHESQEGRFEADRVLRDLHAELERIYRDPELRPQLMPQKRETPAAKKATPRLTTIPGGRTGSPSRGQRPSLRVVRNENGEFSLVLTH